MLLSKLAQATANAVKEIAATKGKKITKSACDKTQAALQNAKGCMDALAVQGKAMVKKFDDTTNKMADKITQNLAESQKNVSETVTCATKNTPDAIKAINEIPISIKSKYDGQKLLFDGDQTRMIKDANASAKVIDGQLTFNELAESGLSHKSAKESAKVFEEAFAKRTVDMKNELSQKYSPEQIKLAKLKRELKAKHANKLQ